MTEPNQSEWNQAFAFMERVDALFRTANMGMMSQNAHMWFYSLWPLSMELNNYIKDEDQTKLKEDLFPKIQQLMPIYYNTKKIIPAQWNLLVTAHLIIQAAYAKAGLQTKFQTDARVKR